MSKRYIPQHTLKVNKPNKEDYTLTIHDVYIIVAKKKNRIYKNELGFYAIFSLKDYDLAIEELEQIDPSGKKYLLKKVRMNLTIL